MLDDAPHTADRTPAADAAAPSGPLLLAAITEGLAGGTDLQALLGRFLEPIVRLSGAEAGAVRVLSSDSQRLELVSAVGLPAAFFQAEQAVDRHCGHCGSAADGHTMAWAAELDACARRSGPGSFSQRCHRMLALPLQHRGRVLGVYNLFFAAGAEPAAPVMAVLKSVGELLGLALNNARLEAEQLRARLAQERQSMAAEVHDSLAQSITFLKMRMALLQDALAAKDDAKATRYCQEVRAVASQAHASLRGILTHLRTPMDPLGLLHAIENSVQHFADQGGARIEFVNELPGLSLPEEHEAHVFHVVQEALNNIARHAGASQAWLHIAAGAPGMVRITIDDDGIGPAGAGGAGPSHYGLEIMHERARRIGGRLDVVPRSGGGTRVQLRFPLQQAGVGGLH
jgi:two-component system nitrate/nitrite sensor histidine kinase NarX